MASFTNMATLSYNGSQINSNVVTGELRDALTVTKTAVSGSYRPGDTVTYVVTLTNTGTALTWAAAPRPPAPCIPWPMCRAASSIITAARPSPPPR